MKLKQGQEIKTKERTYTYQGLSEYPAYHGLHLLRDEKFNAFYFNDEQLKKLLAIDNSHNKEIKHDVN